MAHEESIRRVEELILALDAEMGKFSAAFPALKTEMQGFLAARIAELSAQNRQSGVEAIREQCAAIRVELGAIAERYLAAVMAERQKLIGLDELTHTLTAFATKAAHGAMREFAAQHSGQMSAVVKRELAAYTPLTQAPTPPSVVDVFRGTFDADTSYARGDIFAFRGSCYLVLKPSRGVLPTKQEQQGPNPRYALLAAAGSPGPSGAAAPALTIQAANTIFAGPAAGGDAMPTFRAMVNADVPTALTGKSYNGLTLTATTGTLTLTNGKTLSVSNTLTFAGTDGTTMTFPSTTATIARTDAGQTFTGTQVITTINSPAATNLTLAAGSSGATIVAGQGSNGGLTFTPMGTGPSTFNSGWVQFNGTVSGIATNLAIVGFNFGYNRSGGGGESNLVWGTGAGTSRALILAGWDGSTYTEYGRLTNTGNFLWGTTTDISGAGGARISGLLSFGGAMVGGVQALSGAGAANVTTLTTALTTTGAAQAITLADGSNGQVKTIIHDVDGGSAVLTPTTKTGFTTITFTNVGETATLQFLTTRGWFILALNGAVAA